LSNIDITLEVNSNYNASELFTDGAKLQFATYNIVGGSCMGSFIDDWIDFNKSWQNICSNPTGRISFNSEVGIAIKLLIPETTPPGAKESIISFRGS